MTTFFLKIVDMSLTASWLILAVLLLRFIFKKVPKWIHVLLWGIVAVRLICPFTIESAVSLLPSFAGNGEVVSEWADHYIDEIDVHTQDSFYYDSAIGAGREPVSDGEGGYYVVTKHDQLGEPATIENAVAPILAVVWIVGTILLLLYMVISYWYMHQKVSDAVRYKDNIFQSEYVDSPFVFGIFRARIYLPFFMDERNRNHVIAHEQAHISRKDHWWKPMGFLLLAIHWFNPLVWLAYVLLCRDIELACDEKVIKELGREERAEYTEALVKYSVGQRVAVACPLAFGEVGVKERVNSIMKYKKAKFWIVVTAIICCLGLTACFFTKEKDEEGVDSEVIIGADIESENAGLSESNPEEELSEQDQMAADIIYQLELSTLGKEFRDMDETYKNQILAEYGSLLEGYTFVARESVDGEAAYILGSYEGELANNPLRNMTSSERWEGDRGYQLIYEMPDKEIMWEDGYQEKGIEIEDSRMTHYDDDYKIILIQPVTVKISLYDAMAGYFWNGPDYIPDAVSRGIAIHIPEEPYLNIYLISEKYGETTETIPLTETEAQAIMKEEKVSLPEGCGLGASLYMNGESEYYSEAKGVPQTVIDLALERCGYKFETPKDITGNIVEARLDWFENQPLYLAEDKLGRLQDILTGAEFGFVGGCGYSAKLTITLESGEQMVMFKGCDSCDTIVFGSYGGYFLGDDENTEFWEMFGLDAVTHGML